MKDDVQNFDASNFHPENDSPTINLEETIFPALGIWLSNPVWKEGEEKVPSTMPISGSSWCCSRQDRPAFLGCDPESTHWTMYYRCCVSHQSLLTLRPCPTCRLHFRA